MAAPQSDTELFKPLTASLVAANSSLPSTLSAPPHGLSLLDTKNDLLASYLQHISFLLLLRSRSIPFASHPSAITALIKLRLLLERGIKPLESKLKYQIDKVVAAAKATEARQSQPQKEEDDGDGSSISSDSGEEPEEAPKTSDLSFRPDTAALMAAAKTTTSTSEATATKNGIYRPPRIAPVAMPEPGRPEAAAQRPVRSRALEGFIADEVSSAPMAEPSIGTTIAGGGRAVKTAAEQRVERERQDYEESNFVRLPKASKKELAAQRRGQRGARENAFGGEDWRSFAGDLDKITRRAEGAGRGVLERSRKRGAEENGERDGRIGERFERRKKTLKKRRKM